MRAVARGLTDIGHCRSANEDHLLVDDDLGLHVVADGIGGEAGGEVAARLAVATVAQYIHERRAVISAVRDGYGDETRLARFAVEAIRDASREVLRTAQAFADLEGMGCTLTLLLMGRSHAVMAHVGDSRLYRQRRGAVRQLSTDHNVAQELVDMGAIEPEQMCLVWGGRSLTRTVGRSEQVRVEAKVIELEPGDRFVLCSDGLSDYLSAPEHLGQLLADDDCATSAAALIDFARSAGGQDNITAVVVDVGYEHAPTSVADHPADMFNECITGH